MPLPSHSSAARGAVGAALVAPSGARGAAGARGVDGMVGMDKEKGSKPGHAVGSKEADGLAVER